MRYLRFFALLPLKKDCRLTDLEKRDCGSSPQGLNGNHSLYISSNLIFSLLTSSPLKNICSLADLEK